MPYLNLEETSQLIKDSWNKLNPDGLIYMSTMEDDYSKSGYRKGSQGDEIFMHYYLEKDLKNMLEQSNFNILYIHRVESIMTDNSKVIDLIIIAKK